MLSLQKLYDESMPAIVIDYDTMEIKLGDIFTVRFADEFTNETDLIRWFIWIKDWYDIKPEEIS